MLNCVEVVTTAATLNKLHRAFRLSSLSPSFVRFAVRFQLRLSAIFKNQFHFFSLLFQVLDEVIKDLMASVHRELSDKQSLAFSMTFLPTKLELTTASAENSFVFEFATPDARSSFEQAFEEAKKKLGKWEVSK